MLNDRARFAFPRGPAHRSDPYDVDEEIWSGMAGYRLDPDEQTRFETDGYILRERAFDRHEVQLVVEHCEQLVRDVARQHRGGRAAAGSYVFEEDRLNELIVKWEGDTDIVHGLEPFVHLSAPLAQLAADPRFVHPMIDIVGDPAPMLFTEKLNLKRPRHGGHNPLHQDLPYWYDADDAARIATAMLFLDDSDLENGTLEVVPGSHHDGQWATRVDRDFLGNFEIDPALEVAVETVALEVPAGSISLFGPLLVHRSRPNESERERRSILFSYQPPGLRHMRELLRAEAAST